MDIGRAPQSIYTISGIVHNPRAPHSLMHVCSLESPTVCSCTPKAKQLPSVQAENSECSFRIRGPYRHLLLVPMHSTLPTVTHRPHPLPRFTPPSPLLPFPISAAGHETAFPTTTPQVIPGNFCSLGFEVLWQLGLHLLLNFVLAVL